MFRGEVFTNVIHGVTAVHLDILGISCAGTNAVFNFIMLLYSLANDDLQARGWVENGVSRAVGTRALTAPSS